MHRRIYKTPEYVLDVDQRKRVARGTKNNKMVSSSVMAMANYPAVAHIKSYHPVRRDMMSAVSAFTKHAQKRVSTCSDEHWNFCHQIIPEVSKSFGTLILQIAQPQLRDSVSTTPIIFVFV